MKTVYAIADNIISPLGLTTAENIENLENGVSGISFQGKKFKNLPSFYAALLENATIDQAFSSLSNPKTFTKLEKMAILSIREALRTSSVNPQSNKTLFLFSTTKGNIDLLKNSEGFPRERVYLTEMAKVISGFFQNPNDPIVISNACISGVLAIITARDLIRNGAYDHVIVCGCDLVSEFVLAGFFSFQAISSQSCRPFDISRDGISLGEGSGTIILSSEPPASSVDQKIEIGEGATSNDANHISGPSRTGDGLHVAISKALKNSKLLSSDINYVSAHGTGTSYNDEMETKALVLSNLPDVPLNSLKGYFGHTLGAAGIIETIVSIGSLKQNKLFASKGFETLGVSSKINIIKNTESFPLKNCLKLASGFGGCNAALVISKH